jgi:hypothetical protein
MSHDWTYGSLILANRSSGRLRSEYDYTASMTRSIRSIDCLNDPRAQTTQAHYCQKSLDTVNSAALSASGNLMPGTSRYNRCLDFSDRRPYWLCLGVGAEGFEPLPDQHAGSLRESSTIPSRGQPFSSCP